MGALRQHKSHSCFELLLVVCVSKVGEIVPEELEKAGLPRTIRSRVQADLAQGKE